MPCFSIKSATALVMLVALLFTAFLFANRFGQSFLVDQIYVPSDAAEIAGCSFHGGVKHPVVSRMHVSSERDVAIRMSEFDCSPRSVETTGSPRGHACQSRRDLRNCSDLGQFGFQTHIREFARTQKADEPDPHVVRQGTGMRIHVNSTRGPHEYTLVGQALHPELQIA